MKTKSSVKSFTNIIIMVMISFLFFSCSSTITVTTDYNKGTDFSGYKTYNFVKEVADIPMNELNKNRLSSSIEKELNAKGLTKSEDPDLIIDIQLNTRTEQSATSYTSYYGGHGRRRYSYGGGFSSTHTSINTYIVGTVFINLVDNKKNEMVWQGIGSGTVDFDAKNREEKIEKNVAKIISRYPPEEKK